MKNTKQAMNELAGTLYHRHDRKQLAEEIMYMEERHPDHHSDELLIDKVASVLDDHLENEYDDGRKMAWRVINDLYETILKPGLESTDPRQKAYLIGQFETLLKAHVMVNVPKSE